MMEDTATNGEYSHHDIQYPPKGNLCGMACRAVRFGNFRTAPTKPSSFYIAETGLFYYIVPNDAENSWRLRGTCANEICVYSYDTPTTSAHGDNGVKDLLVRPPLHPEKTKAFGNFNIHISWKHVQEISYYFGTQLSVIFVVISPIACEKLRSTFRLNGDPEKDADVLYFDSTSKRTYHKYITTLINLRNGDDCMRAGQRLRDISQLNSMQHVDFLPLSSKDANRLLMATLPPKQDPIIYSGQSGKQSFVVTQSNPNKRCIGADAALALFQCENTAVERNKCSQKIAHLPRINVVRTLSNITLLTARPNHSEIVPRLWSPTTSLSSCRMGPSSQQQPACVLPAATKEPDELVIYPPGSDGPIIIHQNDLRCLQEGEFLNDIIINFYLDYLINALQPDQRQRVHLFTTYFWTKLCLSISTSTSSVVNSDGKKELVKKDWHVGVRRWTKQVDIFDKDFIVIPIHEDAHWYLAIICYPYLDAPVFADNGKECGGVQEKVATTASVPTAGMNCAPFSEFPDDILSEVETTDDSQAPLTVSQPPGSQFDGDHQYGVPNGPPPAKRLRPLSNVPVLKEPCIVVLDSLREGITPKYKTSKIIRDYLAAEWAFRKPDLPARQFPSTAMKGTYPKAPQQNNYSDCGVFLLEYAERFLFNDLLPGHVHAGSSLAPVGQEFWKMIQASNHRNLSSWFPVERVKAKRSELKTLLLQLAKDWKESQTIEDKQTLAQSSVKHDDIIVVSDDVANHSSC